jgi:hypothetical protein
MKYKIIRFLFFANLTVAGIALGLVLLKPNNPGVIMTGIGALCAAIICGMALRRIKLK